MNFSRVLSRPEAAIKRIFHFGNPLCHDHDPLAHCSLEGSSAISPGVRAATAVGQVVVVVVVAPEVGSVVVAMLNGGGGHRHGGGLCGSLSSLSVVA